MDIQRMHGRLLEHTLAKLHSFRVVDANAKDVPTQEYDRWAKMAVAQIPKLERWLKNIDIDVNIVLQMAGPRIAPRSMLPASNKINLIGFAQPSDGEQARSAWMLLHMMFQEASGSIRNVDEHLTEIEYQTNQLVKVFYPRSIPNMQQIKYYREMFTFNSARKGTIQEGEIAFELATHVVATNFKPLVNLPQLRSPDRSTMRKARDNYIKLIVREVKDVLKVLKAYNGWITF